MAGLASPTTITQPFGYFKHIILKNGQHIELECPICHANSRGDHPHDPLNGVESFETHVKRCHNDASKTMVLPDDLEARVLTPAQVQQLQNGDGRLFIQKKVLDSKKFKENGTLAQIVPYNAQTPILLYPTIVNDGNNGYVELSCCFCGGNAHTARGSNRAKNPKLDWLHGIIGMTGHIKQVHREQAKGWKDDMSVTRCGQHVNQQRFDQLKQDHSGTLIRKVSGTPEATLERRQARRDRIKNGIDELTADGNDVPSPLDERPPGISTESQLLLDRYPSAKCLFRLATAGDQEAVDEIAIGSTPRQIREKIAKGYVAIHPDVDTVSIDIWVQWGGEWVFPWDPDAVATWWKAPLW